MIMFGDLRIMSFIPRKTYNSILSTSIRTKSNKMSEGKTSSKTSTTTYQFLDGSPLFFELVQILEPPVLSISITSMAFEQLEPAPALKTVAISANPLKYTFFSARLWDTLKGQNMNSLPFLPKILPSTTASMPTCVPTFKKVYPGQTNLAIFLRFRGYQLPELMINFDTNPSNLSTKSSTPSYMVGTSTYLQLSQNL